MPENFKPAAGSGDAGFTSLFGGKKVHKTNLRVAAGALIDDLNSLLGLVRAGAAGKDKAELAAVQRQLICAAGLIAGAGTGAELQRHIKTLSALTARRAKALPPLKEFVIPGKNRKEAFVHLARSRARLCELLAWRLKLRLPAVYLNRLSDYLFLFARKL